MFLQELKEAAYKLPTNDRLALISALVQSIQNTTPPETATETWQFLVARPHPWRQQQYIKGQKLLASTVWRDMIANQMSIEQAADNWDLPIGAIVEVVRYCEIHQDLLKLEAQEERHQLQKKEVELSTLIFCPISA